MSESFDGNVNKLGRVAHDVPLDGNVLNEFLKEDRTVQELKSTVAKQEETILQQKKDFQAVASQQQKQIEALTAGLQKVNAQVETSGPAPQVVSNNQ